MIGKIDKLVHVDKTDRYKCPSCGSHLSVILKINPYSMDGALYLKVCCTNDKSVETSEDWRYRKNCPLIDARYKPLNLLTYDPDLRYEELVEEAKVAFIEELKLKIKSIEHLIVNISKLKSR